MRAAALTTLLGAASAHLTDDYVSSNADSLWAAFRRTHRPGPYESVEEEKRRYGVFVDNMHKAARMQAKSSGAKFGVGPLADVTEEEFKAMRGLRPRQGIHLGAKRQTPVQKAKAAPSAVDWRAKGAVTSVKNQGQCGDCWSFSSTGAIEGAWFLAGNSLTSVSEQQLTSCDKVDSGCNGGLMDQAFQWLLDNTGGAIATEASYPFTSGDGTNAACAGTGTTGATISGYGNVVTSEDAIGSELANGPVAIAVDATDWQHYTSGVLTCTTNNQIDHGVLAVGFGSSSADGDYWIIKNSWGPSWGESGYVRVTYGVSSCLIGQYGVQPRVSSLAANATKSNK